jgi:hypothetical protein
MSKNSTFVNSTQDYCAIENMINTICSVKEIMLDCNELFRKKNKMKNFITGAFETRAIASSCMQLIPLMLLPLPNEINSSQALV